MLDLDAIPAATLLVEKQVSEILQVTPPTLRRWRCEKTMHLPYIKVGVAVRYRAGDVKTFIESCAAGNGRMEPSAA